MKLLFIIFVLVSFCGCKNSTSQQDHLSVNTISGETYKSLKYKKVPIFINDKNVVDLDISSESSIYDIVVRCFSGDTKYANEKLSRPSKVKIVKNLSDGVSIENTILNLPSKDLNVSIDKYVKLEDIRSVIFYDFISLKKAELSKSITLTQDDEHCIFLAFSSNQQKKIEKSNNSHQFEVHGNLSLCDIIFLHKANSANGRIFLLTDTIKLRYKSNNFPDIAREFKRERWDEGLPMQITDGDVIYDLNSILFSPYFDMTSFSP